MSASDDGTIQFDCADCDLLVISIGPDHHPGRRCAGCQFLADMPNRAERELLRAHMAESGSIGIPKPHAGDVYVDTAYPVRPCDRCGRPYQGAALYCSLACAVADA